MKQRKTYIGIGSNLADPIQQVLNVLPILDQIKKSRLLAQSSLYQSEAISNIPQQDYINAVACLQTGLDPMQFLLELQAIECAFHRQRSNGLKWAPRTMDLDIILFDNVHQSDPYLTIPHPEMHHRLFVLQPLREITGDLTIPGLGRLEKLIKQAPPLRIRRLERNHAF